MLKEGAQKTCGHSMRVSTFLFRDYVLGTLSVNTLTEAHKIIVNTILVTGESILQQDSTPSNHAKIVGDLHNYTLPSFFNNYSHPIPLTTLFKMTWAKSIPKCCKMISSPACLDIPSQTPVLDTGAQQISCLGFCVHLSVIVVYLQQEKEDCPCTSESVCPHLSWRLYSWQCQLVLW